MHQEEGRGDVAGATQAQLGASELAPGQALAHHLGEDDDRVDAVGAGLCDLVDEAIRPAEAVHPRHGANGDVLVAVVHEQREDEVVGADDGLLDGALDGGAAPVAAGARQDVLCTTTKASRHVSETRSIALAMRDAWLHGARIIWGPGSGPSCTTAHFLTWGVTWGVPSGTAA